MELEKGVPGESKVCSMKKQRKKKQAAVDLFLDYAKNTTLHGLRYVTEVGLTVVEKVFWILTFLISVVICFILMERLVYKWWNSPIIVTLNERMVSVREVPFPSITICPQKKCKVSVYNYTENFIKYARKRTRNEQTYDDISLFEDVTLVCEDNMPFALVKDRYISNESLVNNIIKIAPSLKDSMVACIWRGKMVKCVDYFKEVLTSEGLCFNFNALAFNEMFKPESVQSAYEYIRSETLIKNWNIHYGYNTDMKWEKKESEPGNNKTKMEEDLKYFPRRGQENGAHPDLSLLLVEDFEELDESCNLYLNGWKIYIQHPADMPQASLYYYATFPSQTTSLALKFSIVNTSEGLMDYKPEQLQCYFPKDHDLKYFATYTPDNCRLECLTNYTYKRCKCVSFHMPHWSSSEICTARKKRCVLKAQDEFVSQQQMQSNCNCLPSCNSIHYEAEVIKTTFEFSRHNRQLKRLYNFSLQEGIGFSKLAIFFKEPRFVSMRRSELYGLADVLANCGGLLGLFLGFSLLSLVEIFYFFSLRLWCTFKKDAKIEGKQLKENKCTLNECKTFQKTSRH